MPIYIYEHPETGEIKEIIQGMNEPHQYKDENGDQWKRVLTVPNVAIDNTVDPFSTQQFVNKTGNSKGTIGDVMDRAKDLSEARKKRLGFDPVQNKYFDEWSKKRAGKQHPADHRPFKPQKLKVSKALKPKK